MALILISEDYVLYDEANDHVVQFESSGKIILYGDKQEAIDDCRGNERVIRCTDLPQHWQREIIKQIFTGRL